MNWKSLEPMAALNWREEGKRLVLVVAALALSILCAIHLLLAHLIERQSVLSAMARTQLQALASMASELRVRDEQLATLIAFNRQTRHYQAQTHKFFSAIGSVAGQGVCFTAITRQANKIILDGYSVSVDELMRLLAELRDTGIFTQLDVGQLWRKQNTRAIAFKLQGVEKALVKSPLPTPESSLDAA